MFDFIAIDFETANADRASACSIGAVKVISGEVQDTFSSLINPPGGPSSFAPANIAVHGIQPSDVVHAPTFDEVWSAFDLWAGSMPLVAHNAGFDMSVLSKTFPIYGIEPIEREYFCSLVLSRQHLELVSYSLPFVADALGLGNFDHHEALADAMAAAEVVIRLGELTNTGSLESLAKSSAVVAGTITKSGASGTHKVRRGATRDYTNSQIDEIKASLDLTRVDQSTIFWNKKFVFTGTLSNMVRQQAMAEVLIRGGDVGSSVSRDTDYLVFGSQDARHLRPGAEKSAKFEKALALRQQGSRIEVVAEEVFLGWLELDYEV